MKGKWALTLTYLWTIVALVIGLFGIPLLIVVGEGANNAVLAFGAVSIPFAVLAAIFSWIAPQARWSIAAALAGPVTFLSIAGSWSGSIMMLGALWTAGVTFAGSYVGAWTKQSRSPKDVSSA